MPRKKITPEEIIKAHESVITASLEEKGLEQTLVVNFPRRKKPPLLAQFCIWIVNSYGGMIVTKYQFKNATINSKSRQK